jgi:hypothetical protein
MMHEDAALIQREDRVRRGLTLLLMDVQHHLKYPQVLDLNKSMDILLDRFLGDESILYIRGKSTVYKPKSSTPTTLFVKFMVHRQGKGIEIEEVQLELLSESFVVKMFDPLRKLVDKVFGSSPQLSFLSEQDIVVEYILFWLSDLIHSLIRGEGVLEVDDQPVELISVQTPIWGDERETVTIELDIFGNECKVLVPFTKAM